jgi:CBS domain-containing protein
LSGEWAANWSLASYEDVGQFFQDNLFKDDAAPGTSLGEIMSVDLRTTTPDAAVASIKSLFEEVSGIPVVKTGTDRTLVGVVSKKDLEKSGSLVKDIMSSPPIAAKASNKVADAACLMLKHKVHRIPVVDDQARLIGIVTRTDIFTALESETVLAEK